MASKELFFGMLSHELRTPLTPLVALLEDLAADRRHSVEDLGAFAIMRRNLDLETHLIDDLLDLTRMTGGKLQLRREITNVHLCLQQAIGICQTEIDAKTESHDRFPCHPALCGRRSQPAPAGLLELDQNAQVHAPGGRIAIETRCDQAQSTVEIRDSGIG